VRFVWRFAKNLLPLILDRGAKPSPIRDGLCWLIEFRERGQAPPRGHGFREWFLGECNPVVGSAGAVLEADYAAEDENSHASLAKGDNAGETGTGRVD
jgi:hypothetical protein